MPTVRDPHRLVTAATLYYVDQRSQAEVADLMQTSRSNVSRMLTEALRLGIVEIRVHDPSGRVTSVEAELADRFGLDEVRVAARRQETADVTTLGSVGRQAANLLLGILRDGLTVAVSWGQTLQSMVYAMTPEHDTAARFLPLVGGMSSVTNEITGQELVRELAVRTGGAYEILFAPATFTSGQARDLMLGQPSISSVLDHARKADVAFVGLGVPTHGSSAAVLDSMGLSAQERAEFMAAKPVGDVIARYYDADGRPIGGLTDERALGISLGDLQLIPRVVGVAHGRSKASAVLGALRGKLIDSLVCDEQLARALLATGGKGRLS